MLVKDAEHAAPDAIQRLDVPDFARHVDDVHSRRLSVHHVGGRRLLVIAQKFLAYATTVLKDQRGGRPVGRRDVSTSVVEQVGQDRGDAQMILGCVGFVGIKVAAFDVRLSSSSLNDPTYFGVEAERRDFRRTAGKFTRP